MKQTRPFQATITDAMKRGTQDLTNKDSIPRGYFFDTSGRLRMERINPTAQYGYLWTTKTQ